MAVTGTAYPLVNGARHSWASVEIRLAGQIVLGITEINYTPTLEPAVVYGAGSQPIGMTVGKAEYEGEFTILLEEYNTLVSTLGDGFMTQFFDIVVSYDTGSTGLSVIVDTLQACRITKVESSNSSTSTDASVRKCSLKMLGILSDGFQPGPDQPSAVF